MCASFRGRGKGRRRENSAITDKISVIAGEHGGCCSGKRRHAVPNAWGRDNPRCLALLNAAVLAPVVIPSILLGMMPPAMVHMMPRWRGRLAMPPWWRIGPRGWWERTPGVPAFIDYRARIDVAWPALKGGHNTAEVYPYDDPAVGLRLVCWGNGRNGGNDHECKDDGQLFHTFLLRRDGQEHLAFSLCPVAKRLQQDLVCLVTSCFSLG